MSEWLENPSRSDMALAAQAVRKGWAITDEMRAKIVDKMFAKALSDDDRTSNIATRNILAAEKNDMAREKLELDKQKAGQANSSDILELSARIDGIRAHGT